MGVCVYVGMCVVGLCGRVCRCCACVLYVFACVGVCVLVCVYSACMLTRMRMCRFTCNMCTCMCMCMHMGSVHVQGAIVVHQNPSSVLGNDYMTIYTVILC